MLKNRFVLAVLAVSLSVGCFASDETKVIESSANENLIKTLRLHEDVMLKLIRQTADLKQKVDSLENKIAKLQDLKKSTQAINSSNSSVSSKYDKEFRAYIEASKKAK